MQHKNTRVPFCKKTSTALQKDKHSTAKRQSSAMQHTQKQRSAAQKEKKKEWHDAMQHKTQSTRLQKERVLCCKKKERGKNQKVQSCKNKKLAASRKSGMTWHKTQSTVLQKERAQHYKTKERGKKQKVLLSCKNKKPATKQKEWHNVTQNTEHHAAKRKSTALQNNRAVQCNAKSRKLQHKKKKRKNGMMQCDVMWHKTQSTMDCLWVLQMDSVFAMSSSPSCPILSLTWWCLSNKLDNAISDGGSRLSIPSTW